MKKITLLITLLLLFTFTGCKTTEPTDLPEEKDLFAIYNAFSIEDELEDTQLPTEYDGVSIEWISSDPSMLDEDFSIIQKFTEEEIVLTAYLKYNDIVLVKNFEVTILMSDDLNPDDYTFLTAKIDEINFNSDLTESITLPIKFFGVDITWDSDQTNCMDNTGVITRPDENSTNCTANLTATFSYKGHVETKTYSFIIQKMDPAITYTGYYQGASGLTGATLKQFLHNLIDDHTVLSYGDLRDALQESDEDPNNPNNIILIYTGDSVSSTWDSGNTWNREHVWPRSHGDLDSSNNPANSDMHHVRPSHPIVNSTRGNKDFDNGGSLMNHTDDCYFDGDSFEPRDEVKGDVARMVFYMAVRYEGDTNYEVDLEIADYTGTFGALIGDLDTLLEWHLEDPVDDFEMNRNNVIYSYQGNRNPFIDHPEFVELIWGN